MGPQRKDGAAVYYVRDHGVGSSALNVMQESPDDDPIETRPAARGDARDADDARELARLGYRQELLRRLGGFSSFAIGFSVISVLTGVTSAFGDALGAGGPVGLGLGWPLVSAGTLIVAMAMAELASAFPTAGALYHWSALLGGAPFGWTTALLNLIGQVAIVAAIDLACAQALSQTISRPALAYPLFVALLAVHGSLNAASVRLVAWLNDASATVHMIGVAALAGLLLARGRVHGIDYLVGAGSTSDSPGARGFLHSLVLGVWTFTGFDAAAHVSEETHHPRRRAPMGIVSSVAVSAVAGYALVASLVLSIRDVHSVAGAPDAALQVLQSALGDRAGRFALGLAILAMWFAGLSSVTSASRMLFAFARDGGLPGAHALRRVHPRTRTPIHATAVCVVAPLALVAATAPFSETVFLAIAALATLTLYASYALPIGLGAVARMQRRWTETGPWHLGRAGIAIAWAAVGWTVLVFAVCTLANALSMQIFAMLVLVLGPLWFLVVRHKFVGPRIGLAHLPKQATQAARKHG
jgi:amino acid transporter